MGSYEQSTSIAVPADRLFEYLSQVDHLPEYMPRITSVRDAGDGAVDVTAHIDPPDGPARDVEGRAWLRVRGAGQSLEWGSEGPNDYSGELDVDAEGDGSRLTVRLKTERVEGGPVEDGLREALNGIKRLVESTDVAG